MDFNCSNTLVLSNGQQINKISIKESKRLKRLQRRKEKKVKGSKNRNKLNKLIAREYEKQTNRKNDIANKIINKLKPFNLVVQDDNFGGWSKEHGKAIQHSVLGRIKSKLISFETSKVVGRYERTTNTCHECGELMYLTEKDRYFTCPNCGHSDYRDLNAAKNILKIGLEQSKFTPLESEIDFSSIYGVKIKSLTKKKEISKKLE
jgi:putative transposase